MVFPLLTKRLALRPFCEADLDAFYAYRNDADVARYQGWKFPYPYEKAVDFISEMSSATPGVPGTWYQIAVELLATNDLIGDVAFYIMKDDVHQAYVGYTLARAYWGKGFATEAVRKLLQFLFDDLLLHRVVAECDVENHASYLLLEKLGFRREAHFVENIWFKGEYCSEYHYAMLRREWESKQ